MSVNLNIQKFDLRDSPVEVKRSIQESLFDQVMVNFAIEEALSDTAQEDGPKEVQVKIHNAHRSAKKALKAGGRTPEGTAANITVYDDESIRPLLTLYRALMSELPQKD